MAWDKLFVDAIGIHEKKLKYADASNFSKRYPYHKPMNSSMGGYDGTFESLVFCIGLNNRRKQTMTAFFSVAAPLCGG